MSDPRRIPGTDDVLARRLDVRVRNVGGVLVVARRVRQLQLSDVAAEVWQLLDGTRTVGEIVDRLATDYDAPPDEVREGVVELLEQLVAERFVDVRRSGR
ncbi:PqqD family protein [Micromonospora sp. DT62]|uniref:PqqD family protein n=1 Tax=Micromonospora sp. DT62 TaxID=3416521 RepID=UPI003CE7B7A0